MLTIGRAAVWAAALAVPALAAAGLVYIALPGSAPPPPEETSPAVPAAPASVSGPEASVETPAPESVALSMPEPLAVPVFDVVRVTPEGSALVAGRAEPGAAVTILADSRRLAEATADADGNFVAIFDAPAAAAPRLLSLEAASGSETRTSEETVLLLPAAAPDAPAEAAGAPETAAAEPGPEPEIVATAILREGEVEVAPVARPAGDGTLTLAAISYADEGTVTLAGLGAPGALVRAYVDDGFVEEGRVDAGGRWRLGLSALAAGRYRLRIDQIDADNRVASRVETPFQRDLPRRPAPRPDDEAGEAGPELGPEGSITVQPGHNLWTLAQERYGSGVLYTQIFTANRAQIRDPDLIYPGQIFDVPEARPTE